MRITGRVGAVLATALLVTGLAVTAGPSLPAGPVLVAAQADTVPSRILSTGRSPSVPTRRPPFTALVSVYNKAWQTKSLDAGISYAYGAPSISNDGRFVVFNAVGLHERYYRVFLRDRWTGTTRVVSLDGRGRAVTAYAGQISGNGRYVVFQRDPKGSTTLLVRDLHTHRTFPASVNPAGRVVFGSVDGTISADGRYVTFTARSGAHSDYAVFVRDLWAHRTVQVSVSSSGQTANSSSESGWSSRVVPGPAGGPVVFFRTSATNLTPNHRAGLVGHNLSTGRTWWVRGTEIGKYDVSADGRVLAYSTRFRPCSARPCHSAIYVRNLVTGKTRLASVDNEGRPLAAGCCDYPALSADGSRVAFEGHAQIWLRDMRRNRTWFISVTLDGHPGDDTNWGPDVSADGRIVTFYSTSDNLVRHDTNRRSDAFLRRLP